jgi:glycine cleavage system H protein
MKFAILPCNGLDKAVGPLSREMALSMVADNGGELVCPVLLGNSPDRYAKVIDSLPLLVIDGCATQCATKLANRLSRKISRKVQVAEEFKKAGVTVGKSLIAGSAELEFVHAMAGDLLRDFELFDARTTEREPAKFAPPEDFIEVVYDKFVFKVPASGYYFNENDLWVQMSGNRARIGVTDFAQQNLTDITFFGPPKIGAAVEQFGEAGYIESAKATLDLISPVTGRVMAVNQPLVDAPESINQDPYGKGWAVELEVKDFAADLELLIDGPAYAEIIQKKAHESP